MSNSFFLRKLAISSVSSISLENAAVFDSADGTGAREDEITSGRSPTLLRQKMPSIPSVLLPFNKTACEATATVNTTLLRRRTTFSDTTDEGEKARFKESLTHHKSLLNEYKQKWDYDKVSSRIPTISWPTFPHALPYPPSDVSLDTLGPELRYCKRNISLKKNHTQSLYCDALAFQIAFTLILSGGDEDCSSFGTKSEEKVIYGWNLLKSLAEKGHADSMCYYAQILNNGSPSKELKLDPNPTLAAVWFRRLIEMHPTHSQGLYEMAVLYYTGEGVLEDESKALELFKEAACLNHPGACFMYGDCLLDGVGTPENKRDRSLALEWLIKAGDLGHRGARSRALAVLEFDKSIHYGVFTDASRQTLVSSVSPFYDKTAPQIKDGANLKNGQDGKEVSKSSSVLLNERKHTSGRLPYKTLVKRHTRVMESRQD